MQKHNGTTDNPRDKRKAEEIVVDICDKLQSRGFSIDNRQLAAIIVLLIVTVVGSALFYINSRPKPVVVVKADERTTSREQREEPKTTSAKEPVQLHIHVAGAVAKPGVYVLKDGSRIVDAIGVAGGGAPDADEDALNLAAELIDGQRVYVPKKGEVPRPVAGVSAGSDSGVIGDPTSAGGKVNINLATAEQLDSLPGVGEVTAKKIIDHRTKNGPFRRVEDIMQIDGIGQKKFDALKDEISVESTTPH
ncbi:MAG: helix-hairpin-helix domain-containing protein [Actinobacteria bacterium]|nr:helix-hairpin-helix domain-containing protein [Actinomycetota bacterium]